MVDLRKPLPETDAEWIEVIGAYIYGDKSWQRALARRIGRNQAFIFQVMHRGRKLEARDWRQLDALLTQWREDTLRRVRAMTRVQVAMKKKLAADGE